MICRHCQDKEPTTNEKCSYCRADAHQRLILAFCATITSQHERNAKIGLKSRLVKWGNK